MRNFIIPLLLLLLVIAGCSEQYDEETKTIANKTARSYIENNFQDVDSIELQGLRESPMGSMKIDGTVNNGAEFTISFNEDFTVASMSLEEGFPDLLEECSEKSCDY